jgi:phospholipid/cholesterol/gamma-HCH transport system substrate-binding protein
MSIAKETKVGILVIAALGGLAWLSAQSGILGTSLSSPMRDLSSTFTDVEGINVGSPVKIAGVTVGEVGEIELKPTGTAVVHYKVKKNVPLPADVTAQITTSGLIGERYLALVPGSITPSGTAPLLLPPPAPGGVATSIPSAGGAGGDMASNFGQVGEDLQAMTGTLRSVLGNPENAEKLQRIIDGLATFSDNVGGQSGGTFDKFDKLADSLNSIAARLESGDSTLGALLAKDNGETKQALADARTAMSDLQQVMAKINKGEGTIGKLINDPQTADKIDSALETLAGVGERVEQFRTEVDVHAYSLGAENGIGKGQFTLTLAPRPTRFYVLGATSDGFAAASSDTDKQANNQYFGRDFGNKTKYTAQFGHVFQDALLGRDLAVRVGLKDSTGGIGFDTSVPTGIDYVGDVALSLDAYDFSGSNTPNSNQPHIDAKAKINIWQKTLYGLVGYDNILNQEYGSPIIGLGLRFQDDDLKYILGQAL